MSDPLPAVHPPAEVRVDAASVRRLLGAACPDFATLPVRATDEGWDNFTFRVGDRYAARLPRREVAVELLRNEQRWLPLLAARLPLQVPEPIHLGEPSEHFPWPWSLVKWIPGGTADHHRFGAGETALLAEALAALHAPAPEDAPVNVHRGVPLETRQEVVGERLERLRGRPGVDAKRLRGIWRDACSVPTADRRAWLHGDLHPRNVIVRDGALVGLIDWGDLNGGDVATDLAGAWMLIDAAPRRADFFTAYGASRAEVARASGWAVHMGLALIDSGEPRHVPIGVATLGRVLEAGGEADPGA